MTEFEESSGNVFEDLGFPDADMHLTKARLVSIVGRLIKAQGLTQVAAAERIGMAQPDVSRMLKGQFRSISVDKLLRCILSLGTDVRIMIVPTADRAGAQTVSRGRRRPPRHGELKIVEPAE